MSFRMNSRTRSAIAAHWMALALLPVTGVGCVDGPAPAVEPEPTAAADCQFNSDCPADMHCGASGTCEDGLEPSQCLDDDDCAREERCVFPDNSDVGACIYPHSCDVAADCPDGFLCVVDAEGVRECADPNGEPDTPSPSPSPSPSPEPDAVVDSCAGFSGTFTVENSFDVQTLADCQFLNGSLVIDAPGLTSMEFPRLTSIQGSVRIEGRPGLTSVAAPQLAAIGGDLNIDGYETAAAWTLDMGSLGTIGGTLDVEGGSMATLSLPNLVLIGDRLWIREALNLQNLLLPSLTTVGEVLIRENFALAILDLTALQTIETTIEVRLCRALNTLSLPALTDVGVTFQIGTPTANGGEGQNRNLITINAPALTHAENVWIGANPELTTLRLDSLQTVDEQLYIKRNLTLPSISLPSLQSVPGWLTSIDQNAALQSISIPSVTTLYSLSVYDNESLSTLSLPSLSTMTDVTPNFHSNGTLSVCDLGAYTNTCP